MPEGLIKGGIYQRGAFWLDHERGRDGEPASPYLYVCWYDQAARRIRRKTTRTADARAAIAALDRHYLAATAPAEVAADTYDLSSIIADYWLEHGHEMASADAIRARLAHIQAFIDIEVEAGRLADPVAPEAFDDRFVTRFRTWAIKTPIVARKKGASGEWQAGSSRPRAASTVEESVIQMKAAVNHAIKARRIPPIHLPKHRTRSDVTPRSIDRISLETLSTMVGYAQADPQREALLRYLVAAITTLARPDAILDISTRQERQQWLRADGLLNLNPAGRQQTKKHRPIVRAGPTLTTWLEATEDWLICGRAGGPRVDGLEAPADDRGHPGFSPRPSVSHQIRVRSIRRSWDTMRSKLDLPASWGPKLLRHSMGTHLRTFGVDPLELSGQLGHRTMGTTETYAIFDPKWCQTVQSGIEHVIQGIERALNRPLHPSCTQETALSPHEKPKIRIVGQ